MSKSINQELETNLAQRVAELEKKLEEKENIINQLINNDEKRLKKVQELAKIGYWSGGLDSLYWSEEHFELLGYKNNEVKPSQKLFLSHVHQEDRSQVNKIKEESKKNKKDFFVEFRFFTKNKEMRWARSQAEIILDNNGVFVGFDGVFQDITDIKKTELSLLNNQQHLESVFESSPNAITVTDLKGNIIQCNQATAVLHGYSNKSELIGKSINDLIPKKQQFKAISKAIETIKKGKTRDVEYILLKKDGSTFPANISTSLVKNSNGKSEYFMGITQDLSMQKQAENALRESEEKYKTLVESTLTPIVVFNNDYICTFANKIAAGNLGKSQKQVIGKSIYDILDSDIVHEMKDRLDKVLIKGENITFETKFSLAKGEKWLLSDYQPIYSNGKVNAVQIVSHDITSQKTAEIAIAESEKRFKTLFNHASDAIYVSDSKGNIIDINKQACLKLGYTRNELLTKTVMDIDVNLSDLNQLEIIWNTIDKNKSKVVNSEHIRKDGHSFPVEIHIRKIYFDGHELLLGFARDVTQQQKAKDILKESEERYRVLANATMEAVFISDKGICIDTNDTACKMFGYTYDEIMGVFGTDVVAPESKELVKNNMISGYNKPYEAMAQKKDGTIFPVEFHGRMYDYKGKKIRLTTCRDLSEQKEYERRIKENQNRLERAEAIAGVGHWEFHLNSKKVFASKGAYNIYGLDENKSLTITDVQKFPLSEYRELLNTQMSRLIRENKPYDVEFKIKRLADNKIMDIHSFAQYDKERNVVFGVIHDITEQVKAEQRIKDSEVRFRALFNYSPLGMAVSDFEFKNEKTITNKAFQEFIGYTGEELEKITFKDYTYPEDYEQDYKFFNEVLKGERDTYRLEKRFVHKNGNIVWGNLNVALVRNEEQKPFILLGMVEDITQRKNAEAIIKRSLFEKEVLLKEIHHRVKNNMQIIVSLLNMQAQKLNDPNVFKACKESQQRIYSMALVHEKLYQSDDFSKINFKEYIEFLLDHLKTTLNTIKDIHYSISVQESILSLEDAIPCGLIINELLTNAIKHAFKDRQCGNIWVEIKQEKSGKMLLDVRDDGIGLPADLDVRKSGSLGLELIQALTRQIHGTLEMSNRNGAAFSIRFNPISDE